MIGIALLGAGRIGAIHAANILAHPGLALRWIADPVPGAAESLAARVGRAGGCPASPVAGGSGSVGGSLVDGSGTGGGLAGTATTTDPVSAIAADDVDAVVIASPTATHVEFVLGAVGAGKAALCEKPVDLDLERARDCLERVEAVAGRVMMGFNRRFDPTFAAIAEAVRRGRIGRVEQLLIVSRDSAPPSAGYLATSGGMFRDMTIHDLDLARHFLGEMTEVQASGQNVIDPEAAAIGDIDAGVVVARAASGAVATIVNARRCAFGYDQRLEIFGELGMLQAANRTPTAVRTSVAGSTDAGPSYQDFFLERYAESYRAELDAFAGAILSGAPFQPDLRDGVAALELADAALAAMRSRAACAFPPAQPARQ
jgi:myo-inositol 2-dehydrogenase/D-chiro-inositol 1-dehydrogenase